MTTIESPSEEQEAQAILRDHGDSDMELCRIWMPPKIAAQWKEITEFLPRLRFYALSILETGRGVDTNMLPQEVRDRGMKAALIYNKLIAPTPVSANR